MNDPHILLVDDEEEILNLLEIVLHKEGFDHTHKATTADEALKMCRELNPDFIQYS
ncbi:hypothetical protein IC620_15900 [Hazenella sp. IB182357]|uniref:Response regulatory domain-containing protein n=1 Tax=Polycladospora coralii TaxID=2771432 RepID=A0A926RV61_9BACL|nr:hypothetical protein [Polycladospora coralii]MBD1373828.1 hypothetical protein [Polycladospora coralii]MBS7531969.1 hypothetical protein [Polycladospora coralii]